MSEPRSDNLASGLATQLLVRVRDGDSGAARELLPLVYEQLRAIAGGYFRRQGANHTLQPTALVHEAFVKLVAAGNDWQSRAHFCAVASTAMRQILQNHARAKRAAKRAGQRAALTVDRLATPAGVDVIDLLALEDALAKLAALNERQARIVELRFFGGLTHDEIAWVLGLSTRTIEKEWRRTRAWLNRELADYDQP